MKNSDIASMRIRLNTVQVGFSKAKNNKKRDLHNTTSELYRRVMQL